MLRPRIPLWQRRLGTPGNTNLDAPGNVNLKPRGLLDTPLVRPVGRTPYDRPVTGGYGSVGSDQIPAAPKELLSLITTAQEKLLKEREMILKGMGRTDIDPRDMPGLLGDPPLLGLFAGGNEKPGLLGACPKPFNGDVGLSGPLDKMNGSFVNQSGPSAGMAFGGGPRPLLGSEPRGLGPMFRESGDRFAGGGPGLIGRGPQGHVGGPTGRKGLLDAPFDKPRGLMDNTGPMNRTKGLMDDMTVMNKPRPLMENMGAAGKLRGLLDEPVGPFRRGMDDVGYKGSGPVGTRGTGFGGSNVLGPKGGSGLLGAAPQSSVVSNVTVNRGDGSFRDSQRARDFGDGGFWGESPRAVTGTVGGGGLLGEGPRGGSRDMGGTGLMGEGPRSGFGKMMGGIGLMGDGPRAGLRDMTGGAGLVGEGSRGGSGNMGGAGLMGNGPRGGSGNLMGSTGLMGDGPRGGSRDMMGGTGLLGEGPRSGLGNMMGGAGLMGNSPRGGSGNMIGGSGLMGDGPRGGSGNMVGGAALMGDGPRGGSGNIMAGSGLMGDGLRSGSRDIMGGAGLMGEGPRSGFGNMMGGTRFTDDVPRGGSGNMMGGSGLIGEGSRGGSGNMMGGTGLMGNGPRGGSGNMSSGLMDECSRGGLRDTMESTGFTSEGLRGGSRDLKVGSGLLGEGPRGDSRNMMGGTGLMGTGTRCGSRDMVGGERLRGSEQDMSGAGLLGNGPRGGSLDMGGAGVINEGSRFKGNLPAQIRPEEYLDDSFRGQVGGFDKMGMQRPAGGGLNSGIGRGSMVGTSFGNQDMVGGAGLNAGSGDTFKDYSGGLGQARDMSRGSSHGQGLDDQSIASVSRSDRVLGPVPRDAPLSRFDSSGQSDRSGFDAPPGRQVDDGFNRPIGHPSAGIGGFNSKIDVSEGSWVTPSVGGDEYPRGGLEDNMNYGYETTRSRAQIEDQRFQNTESYSRNPSSAAYCKGEFY